ncbi:MAG: NAD(P)-dependent oxidoreductase [Bacteroidota bacterium]
MKRILITDKVHPLLVGGLEDAGYDVTYEPRMPYAEVQHSARQFDGLIINSKVICNRDFLDSQRHLDFIGRLGSGLDIIDLPYSKEVGIEIISSPEGNANAVGEHTLGMLLSVMCNLNRSFEDLQRHEWNREPHRGEELHGKTIGIVGYGHTGPAFAKKLEGFEVDILVYDKYRTGFVGVKEANLNDLLLQSDIVSIHLPLTAETDGMVDHDFLSKCKKGSILINTSRGNIVNSESLLSHLVNGHIGGACLDVLENEKPSTWNDQERKIYDALLCQPNVIITPHIAGWTHQSLERIASILLGKILAFYAD